MRGKARAPEVTSSEGDLAHEYVRLIRDLNMPHHEYDSPLPSATTIVSCLLRNGLNIRQAQYSLARLSSPFHNPHSKSREAIEEILAAVLQECGASSPRVAKAVSQTTDPVSQKTNASPADPVSQKADTPFRVSRFVDNDCIPCTFSLSDDPPFWCTVFSSQFHMMILTTRR
eukprot:Polyplicarium_translucidae@DN269_c0_g1_i1.p1